MVESARAITAPATSRALFLEGLAATATAFTIWGMFPLYLKALHSVSTLQIMAHRVVWCCALVMGWLAMRGELGKVRAALTERSTRWMLAASGVLISVNWLVYVWGVNTGHVVETSLGYFINPLVNVLLGVVVLSERLNRAQWTAVTLAGIAVIYLTSATGQLPWISLLLAVSFGLYGLVRKVVRVDSAPALATETLLMLPFAGVYLVWCETMGMGALGHSSAGINALLLGSGAATAIPLVLFAFGARRIPLSTVGLMQYIAPSLQLSLGVLVYGEPFGHTRLVGFTLIWLALGIYAADGLWRARKMRY